MRDEKLDVNEGYRIRERFTVGECGFVLAERDTDVAGYVTWRYRADDPSNYFWGHYFNTKEAAYADYQERIEKEVVWVYVCTGKEPLLPSLCASVLQGSGNLIMIRRGETGFYPSPHNTGSEKDNRAAADRINKGLKVTKAQEAAMFAGSLFGWDGKAADPRNYNEDGKPKRSLARQKKHHER